MTSGKPGVFISYARKDPQSAQNPEEILQAEGIGVWRDQESIYAGEKWQAKVTFIILLLTLLTVVFEVPGKVKKFYREIFGEPQATCSLKGVVQNSKGMPVSGVVVKVDTLPGQSVMSTGSGSFKFEKVPGRVGDSIRVTAYTNGRLVWDEYVTLPGPVTIILEDP